MRHGETIDNVRQVMQGQRPGELNATGISQAEAVRDALACEHIDAVVSSDLRRAVQTANIVRQPHGLSLCTTPLLRERDWGSFTGRFIPDLRNAEWPPDVEPLETLFERAQRFVSFIRNNYRGQRVLAVGHGIVNKAIQSVVLNQPMKEVPKMANAEIRRLVL